MPMLHRFLHCTWRVTRYTRSHCLHKAARVYQLLFSLLVPTWIEAGRGHTTVRICSGYQSRCATRIGLSGPFGKSSSSPNWLQQHSSCAVSSWPTPHGSDSLCLQTSLSVAIVTAHKCPQKCKSTGFLSACKSCLSTRPTWAGGELDFQPAL